MKRYPPIEMSFPCKGDPVDRSETIWTCLRIVRRLRTVLLINLLIMTGFSGPAVAEDWSFKLTPYVWVPSLDTSLNIGPNPPVDGSTSILDILDGAFLIQGEARRGRWSTFGELNYLDLGNNINALGGFLGARWGLKGFMSSVSLGYAAYDSGRARVETFAGARAWWLDAETEVSSRVASTSRSWVDPIMGARFEVTPVDRLTVGGIFDIGGFGVGSDLQWEVIAQASWAITNDISLVGGYRHLDIDFQDENLVLDMSMSGPFVAIGFEF
jgi:hypothetical protein